MVCNEPTNVTGQFEEANAMTYLLTSAYYALESCADSGHLVISQGHCVDPVGAGVLSKFLQGLSNCWQLLCCQYQLLNLLHCITVYTTGWCGVGDMKKKVETIQSWLHLPKFMQDHEYEQEYTATVY